MVQRVYRVSVEGESPRTYREFEDVLCRLETPAAQARYRLVLVEYWDKAARTWRLFAARGPERVRVAVESRPAPFLVGKPDPARTITKPVTVQTASAGGSAA